MSSFGPDITAIPADASIVTAAKAAFPKFGTFGPPIYAATHVLDEAIAAAWSEALARAAEFAPALDRARERFSRTRMITSYGALLDRVRRDAGRPAVPEPL